MVSKGRGYDFAVSDRLENSTTTPSSIFLFLSSKNLIVDGCFYKQKWRSGREKNFGNFVSKNRKFWKIWKFLIFFLKNLIFWPFFEKKFSEFNRCLELSTVYGPKIDFWKNIFIKNADISSACPKKMPTYLVLVWKKCQHI